MDHDVFISYSHVNQNVADAICHFLENKKLRCWYAPRNLTPGTDWAGNIIKGIRGCRIFVLVFSQHSNISPQVLNEVTNAVSFGCIIIPFRIEECKMSDPMAYYLNSRHWLDAVNPPLEKRIGELYRQIMALLKGSAGARGLNINPMISHTVTRRRERQVFSACGSHAIALRKNGQILVTPEIPGNPTSKWRDVVEVSAGEHHFLGLTKDGRVYAAITCSKDAYSDSDCDRHPLYMGQDQVKKWRDIVQVRAGDYHSLGLRSDGTVVAVGRNDSQQCEVSEWTDIVAIEAGYQISAGIRSDGTVVVAGEEILNRCDVSRWRDIVAVSCAVDHLSGLRADGTVVVTRPAQDPNPNSIFNGLDVLIYPENWTDIIAISSGQSSIMGLKKDGTVVVSYDDTLCPWDVDVSRWENVVSIVDTSLGYYGLRADGSFLTTGICITGSGGKESVGNWHLYPSYDDPKPDYRKKKRGLFGLW